MSSGVGIYRLGPFLLTSELPLPELEALSVSPDPVALSLPNVTIRLTSVPDSIAGVVANESRWWASHDEYLLRVPGVANFLVSHGRQVLVEAAPDSLSSDIRAYLLAPIFSALCYQSGMYSLHASAIRVGSGVVAFVGNTHAGKSTLAASLSQRGYTVLADDMCLLDPRPTATADPGPTLVIPIAPALKLWRSALDQLNLSPETLPLDFSREEKFRIPIPQPSELDHGLPLRAVFFLEWADEAIDSQPVTQPTITPVDGVEAITRLMEFTHFDYLMKPTGRRADNFLLCGRILSHARAYILHRPSYFALLPGTLDALEPLLNALK